MNNADLVIALARHLGLTEFMTLEEAEMEG